MVRIAFDVGGTKTRVAVSEDGKTIGALEKVPTIGEDFEAGVGALCDLAHKLAGGREIEAVGGGTAGVFNEKKSMLMRSPNISGWEGKDIASEIGKRLSAPVFIDNDSVVVGLGEMVAGAGTTEGIAGYITVSTGVGGARFIDGKPDVAAYGFEVGHQTIDFDQSHCVDCPGNDLEDYISGKSLEKRFNKKAYELEDPVLWEHEARLLAIGLANTIVHWSPHVLVLGGSMIVGSPGILVEHVVKHLEEILTLYPTLPEIRKAGCGDTGGLVGALELINQRMGQ